MAIKCFKLKRQINNNGAVVDKYIATMQVGEKIDFERIAEMIEKRSTVSNSDILAVLSELETVMCWVMEEGHPVTLGLLGTFYPSMTAKACDNPKDVTKDTITKFKCIFKPSKYLKKKFKEVEFVLDDNQVHTVKSEKLKVKSEK
jgi:predicted histone-like DNA-binding protein